MTDLHDAHLTRNALLAATAYVAMLIGLAKFFSGNPELNQKGR